MQESLERAEQLKYEVNAAAKKMDIAGLSSRLEKLQQESQTADFWSDNLNAQDVMRQISKLEVRIRPWIELQQGLNDVTELMALGDETLSGDLQKQLDDYERRYLNLKEDLKYSGAYDGHDVILSIHAGAGGSDAQDWTAILLRMYVRWAERNKFSIQTIDESTGDDPSLLKSVTLEISGPFIFGKLKGEHGVHRLVRLSPFNAESRETSFAKVEVMPKIDQPDEVEVDEKDLRVDVYRSGGKGGQSVNTTDSAVRITHIPTGIVVAIQNERSQLQNRETAMTILRSKLAQLQMEQHAEAVSELKGPNEQAAWGNQIRSYVLHPYKQVKDLRSRYETSDIDGVLSGDLDELINAYLEHTLSDNH